MTSPRQTDYLATRVRTASPAQLHLMLIEGALRFLSHADQALERGDEAEANTGILRALKVVEELLAGVRHSEAEINVKLAQLYHFVYLQAARAYTSGDRATIADAVRVLEFQRETWRQACELIAESAPDGAKPAPPCAPYMDGLGADAGLSIEA